MLKKVEVVQLFLDFGDIRAKIVIIVGDILLGENTQVVLIIVTKENYFIVVGVKFAAAEYALTYVRLN
jgi:hypothetical protein